MRNRERFVALDLGSSFIKGAVLDLGALAHNARAIGAFMAARRGADALKALKARFAQANPEPPPTGATGAPPATADRTARPTAAKTGRESRKRTSDLAGCTLTSTTDGGTSTRTIATGNRAFGSSVW